MISISRSIKTNLRRAWKKAVLLSGVGLLALTFPSSAKVMDNGVDPENLGTGDWIYFLSEATNRLGGNVESVTDLPSLMTFYKSMRLDFIAVKAGTGAGDFPSAESPQFTKEVVDAAHAVGIKIFGYTRSNGKDVPGEIRLASKVYDMGADGFIIDAEAEWEPASLGRDGGPLAIELCTGIKKAYPNKFLAHAPMPVISFHKEFPYKEFGLYCDAVMPQDYWKSLKATPTQMVERMDREWHEWQNSLTGSDTNAIKPIAPIGHGWNLSSGKPVTAEEILEFVSALNEDKNPLTPSGYKGVSYWRTDLHTPEMWRGIQAARIGQSTGKPFNPETAAAAATPVAEESKTETTKEDPNEIILEDNSPNVAFDGDWFSGRRPEGHHGETYKCVNASGEESTATATYRPKVSKEGLYDIFVWYSPAPNRSTNSLWIISGADNKTISKHVDQTVGAGNWYLVASDVPFSPTAKGSVTVSNGTGEDLTRVVVADAVRFVLKEKKD